MATSARNRPPVQLRLALKASRTLIPLALFALAFVGALLVLRRPGAPAAAPAKAITAQPVRVASVPAGGSAGSGTDATPSEPPPSHESLSAEPVARALPAPPVPETVAVSEGPPEVPPTAETSPPVADDVAQAISTLREGSPADRVLAIQSLAATGHSGRSLSRVRQTLRFAASDQDPDVAARAQEAYDSLIKRDDP
jgi:hypothetical protein